MVNNICIFHNFKALYCSSTIIKDLSANQIDHFSILMKEKLFNELENYSILIKEKAYQKSLKNLDQSIELLEIDLIKFKRILNNKSWQISYNDFFNKIPEEIKIYSSDDLNYFFNTQSNLSEKNYNLKNSLLHII